MPLLNACTFLQYVSNKSNYVSTYDDVWMQENHFWLNVSNKRFPFFMRSFAYTKRPNVFTMKKQHLLPWICLILSLQKFYSWFCFLFDFFTFLLSSSWARADGKSIAAQFVLCLYLLQFHHHYWEWGSSLFFLFLFIF